MRATYSLLAATVAVLSACSSTGQLPQPTTAVPSVRGTGTWMAPAAKHKKALLYVSSVAAGDVDVYSYPAGKLVGTLTGFNEPFGVCSDHAGDVFIVDDGASSIDEYRHGETSAFTTLSDSDQYPEGCSIDPATGNLAVTNFSSVSGNGSVSIYTGAKGAPHLYSDTHIVNYRFCGYDPHGNLFVDGATANGTFQFAELKKGASAFIDIAVGQTIEWPGGVQWDGKYVAVGDTDSATIYRVNARGRLEGTVKLTGANYVDQFWIDGVSSKRKRHSTVIVPSQDAGNVAFYAYPAGGSPAKTIDVEEPFGATISK